MAEELRWETLISTSITDANAFGEFRNDTSADLFIRSVDLFLMCDLITATTAVANALLQLSKSNTVDLANNTSIYQLNAGVTFMNDETGGVGPNAGAISVNKLYAKGQLILEPGESLFAHLDFSNAPTTTKAHATIGYHF